MIKMLKFRDDGNPYGYDAITFRVFNYDGKGSAIADCDGQPACYRIGDVEEILMGEHPCYVADDGGWTAESQIVTVGYKRQGLMNEELDSKIRSVIAGSGGVEFLNNIEGDNLRTIYSRLPSKEKADSVVAQLRFVKEDSLQVSVSRCPKYT